MKSNLWWIESLQPYRTANLHLWHFVANNSRPPLPESRDVERKTEETKLWRDVNHWQWREHVVQETGDITQLYSGFVDHIIVK